MSVEIALLQHYVLAHDQPVRRHFLQRGKHAIHMLIGVDENDDHRQLASRLDQMRGLDAMPPQESRHAWIAVAA